MSRARSVSRTRTAVIRTSLTLAVVAVVAALWRWHDLGSPAGGDAMFIMSLAVSVAAAIICAQSVVMPDQARLYALGWRDRDRECGCTTEAAVESPPPPDLRVVGDDLAEARARHPSALGARRLRG